MGDALARADIRDAVAGELAAGCISRTGTARLPGDAEGARRFAKDVVNGRLVPSSAWPLYELAFQREGDVVCNDPKLVDVVLGLIDDQRWLDQTTPLVTKRCAGQLKTLVAEKLQKNDSTSFRKGACKVLAGQADVSDALKICEG